MTTQPTHERLLQWLQDAYAMEQEAETLLTAMGGRLEHYGELRARIEQHVGETKAQAEKLKRCIEHLGGSTPAVKGMIATMMAGMHAAGNAMMSDEVAKGVGISYAFEHMEIATYRALVIAAQEAGRDDIADICGEILQEEIAMADWLLDHQEAVIMTFLRREAEAGVTAKR
ncbi:MAG TPA: ferritin-like domain-containing protein [Stenotrophomonas sp.]|nr:ferritin-like domain-containing protein [Stenotrophomonas sp.]